MNRYVRLVIVSAALVTGMTALSFSLISNGDLYPFMKTDHPIDVEMMGGARWYYYSLDNRDLATIAIEARKELLAQGFTEDLTNRPWYRFTKGGKTVIVCDHDDIMSIDDPRTGLRLAHMKLPPKFARQKWVIVWERQPGGSKAEYYAFKIKRTILLW